MLARHFYARHAYAGTYVPVEDYLLLEDGTPLLLEDGTPLLLG